MNRINIEDLDLSLQASIEAIYSFDLSFIYERLIKVDKWTRRSARKAIEQYKNYLVLKRKYGGLYMLPPSQEIDEVWHAHILYTEEYNQFCQDIFGGFLHHHPSITEDGASKEKLEELFDETQTLYHYEFGQYIYPINRKPWWLRFITG